MSDCTSKAPVPILRGYPSTQYTETGGRENNKPPPRGKRLLLYQVSRGRLKSRRMHSLAQNQDDLVKTKSLQSQGDAGLPMTSKG